MNKKHEMRNFEIIKNKSNSDFSNKEPESPMDNYNNNLTNNSFEPTDNVIQNESQTILSNENNIINNYNNSDNRKYNKNITSNTNQGYLKSNSNYAINNNFNKFKQKTIETVLENEGEENCSYNQISGDRPVENDPIVTFVFYKEEGIYFNEENKNEKNEKNENNQNNQNNNEDNILNQISLKDNDDKLFSLNMNNFKPKNVCSEDNKIKNNNNNFDGNFNINDIIDNISQSEIFANAKGKNEKSIFGSGSNLNANEILNEKNSNNKLDKINNYNNADNSLKGNNTIKAEQSENAQTVKYDVLFLEIIQACPIIQLSADTSKV
jgi:hypothetical protein